MFQRRRGSALALTLITPSCCVTADTRVRSGRGERPAGSLVVGDSILSVELPSGEIVAGTVAQVRHATRECMALRWRDGTLVCTPDHPLYDPDRGDYRPAAAWTAGAARRLLVCSDEGPRAVDVASVERYAGLHPVVDLSLAQEPRNFIAAGVVVHNKTPVPTNDWSPPPRLTATNTPPEFTLAAPGEARQFRLFACVDGEDFARGNLSIEVRSATSFALAPDQRLWMSFESDEDPATPRAEQVPSTFYYDGVALPEDPCTQGVLVTFEHVAGPAGAEINVVWYVVVTTDHDADPPGELLEVAVEPP